jgi:hypothetical protein
LVARRAHYGLALIREDAMDETLTLNGADIAIEAPQS